MPHLTDLARKAHVYRFGVRWHWKCGADRTVPGDCLGGPARTQEDAYRAAFDHITADHCELLELPVDPDGCRYCGVLLAEHGVQIVPDIGVHGYRAPTRRQRAMRLGQARRVVATEI